MLNSNFVLIYFHKVIIHLTEDNIIWTIIGYIGPHVHMEGNMDTIICLELLICSPDFFFIRASTLQP